MNLSSGFEFTIAGAVIGLIATVSCALAGFGEDSPKAMKIMVVLIFGTVVVLEIVGLAKALLHVWAMLSP